MAMRLVGGCAAVMRLVGNFVAVIRHHLAAMRSADYFGEVGPVRPVRRIAACVILTQIITESSTDFHNIVFICAMFCVNLCIFCRIASEVTNLKG